jgi:hypothetical protein
MLTEPEIINELSAIGYERLKRHVYKARWGTEEVEHYLYVLPWGKPRRYLEVMFGIRNLVAEQFALDCIRRFGGPRAVNSRSDKDPTCGMMFSLGSFAGWEPRWSLDLEAFSPLELANRLRSDVETYLFPIVREITSSAKLLTFLLNDTSQCPWFRSSGIFRSAQIVWIAKAHGMPDNDIASLLTPYLQYIPSGRPKGWDASAYIADVMTHADKVRTTALKS